MSNIKLLVSRLDITVRFSAIILVVAFLATFVTSTYAKPLRSQPVYYSNRIYSTDILAEDTSLFSLSGRYELRMQSDGNLVLYVQKYEYVWNLYWRRWDKRWIGRSAIWATHTDGNEAGPFESSVCVMQSDGNLVLMHASGAAQSGYPYTDIDHGTPYWSSHTHGEQGSYYLEVQDDGNVVIYQDLGSSDGSEVAVVWATGTSR